LPNDAFRRQVALRLKEARRQRTLTQRQLADLGESTQQNISRYEKGFIPDSWFLLAQLHAEKGIDLNWLLATPPESLTEAGPALHEGTALREGKSLLETDSLAASGIEAVGMEPPATSLEPAVGSMMATLPGPALDLPARPAEALSEGRAEAQLRPGGT
jgi:transcriptional regulator with XRE-family HTH domain